MYQEIKKRKKINKKQFLYDILLKFQKKSLFGSMKSTITASRHIKYTNNAISVKWITEVDYYQDDSTFVIKK